MTTLKLRPGKPSDSEAAGNICYHAFRSIAERHGFPPDIPSIEMAVPFMGMLLSNPTIYSVVAEKNGKIAGSNFMTESAPIFGIGPITVDPSAQDKSIGRKLMENALERARKKNAVGVRLVQSAYHARSLSLYAKLGFDLREHLGAIQGPPLDLRLPGFTVRVAGKGDVDACCQLSVRLHGFERRADVQFAVHEKAAMVVENGGRIVGYSTWVGFFGHSIAETNDGMKALIGAAPVFPGPGFLLPLRNAELFRWCLERGLKVVFTLNLMSLGLYNEPHGAFLPSIYY